MNLKDIQPTALSTIEVVSLIASAGVPVLIDDGTYPKTDGREENLRNVGICVIITPIQAQDTIDKARGGLSSYDVAFDVIVEENVKVNRAVGGTGVQAEEAVDAIMAGMVGRPQVERPAQPFELRSPPWTHFGTVGGVRQIVINFSVRCFVKPINQ